jgi:hypothetical protein
MAGQPREPEPGTGVPRWVKALGIVALALLVIFVIAQAWLASTDRAGTCPAAMGSRPRRPSAAQFPATGDGAGARGA